jgi:hypothetical protein
LRLLRALFALTFGFVSLAHAPVMAFAKSASAPAASYAHHHAAPAAPSHHTRHQDAIPPAAGDNGACNHAFGCFLTVAPVTVTPPIVDFRLLDTLWPALARQILAALPEPADPPPRLQA